MENDPLTVDNICIVEKPKRKAELGRDVLTLDDFSKKFHFQRRPSSTCKHKLKEYYKTRLSHFSVLEWITSLVPILGWLPKYNVRTDLVNDIVAGFTVAVMHIPQGMAYGLLGGVDPVVGIYTAFFPVLLYALLGTMPHVSMGTFAVVSIMVSAPVSQLATTVSSVVESEADGLVASSLPDLHSPVAGTNLTLQTSTYPTIQASTDIYTPIQVATAVTFCVGVIQMAAGMCRLGFLSILLTDTLISSFTVGAGIHVLTSQIKHILGVSIPGKSGAGSIVLIYKEIVQNILTTNYVTVCLSLATLAFCLIVDRIIAPKLKQKCRFPVPTQLMMIVITTTISKLLNLRENYDVRTIDDIGKIPIGLPEPVLPPPQLFPQVLLSSLAPAVVSYSIGLGLGKMFATKHGYEVNSNQELLAQGTANLFGSFFSCLPMAGSLSRSVVQEASGCRSMLTSLVSALCLLVVMLALGPLFQPLPVCVLAAIILASLVNILKKIGDVSKYWSESAVEGVVWLITFLSIVLLSVDIGLVVGILCSVLATLYRAAAPQILVLGRTKEGVWLDASTYKTEDDGMRVLQVSGPLYFLVYESVRVRILEEIGQNPNKLSTKYHYNTLILDISNVSYLDQKGASLINWIEKKLPGLGFAVVATPLQKARLDGVQAEIFPTYIDAVLTYQGNVINEHIIENMGNDPMV
eukprot:TRINITY_DN5654_c0_g1_i1.p1 TRINITY_DN5654_c0_g1~~TRINITY_DN5654_c0_g1_i1.p1  ORF type:complete len:691 (+),score=150.84 TRINITY_DN5654_c0_g1_i1:32-2104(+)